MKSDVNEITNAYAIRVESERNSQAAVNFTTSSSTSRPKNSRNSGAASENKAGRLQPVGPYKWSIRCGSEVVFTAYSSELRDIRWSSSRPTEISTWVTI